MPADPAPSQVVERVRAALAETPWACLEPRLKDDGGTQSNARALAAEFGVCKQYVTELVAGKWRKAA